MKRYRILRFIGGVFTALGMLLFLAMPVSLYQIIQAIAILSSTQPAARLLLLGTYVGGFLLILLGGFFLIAIGELVDLLVTLEDNARYTADYLRLRSRPKP